MKSIILATFIGMCAAGALPGYVNPAYRAQYQYQERPRAALERNAAILRSENEVNENGFRYFYETENGIQADAVGQEANGIQSQGGYSYTGDDGQVYAIRYTADANGFQAQGNHIPTPPPIPAEIARALEENARDEAAGIFDDGSYREGKYADGIVAARTYRPLPAAPAYRPFRF